MARFGSFFGLFALAFGAATLLPLQSEVVLVALIAERPWLDGQLGFRARY
jgi:membrane protein YqaA with SNARE-associated domain